MNSFFLCLLLVFSNSCLLFSETRYKINHLGLDQTHSYAYCINNHGEICGTFTAINSKGKYNSAFYWSEKRGFLELPQGEFFTPDDINDAGVIVGRKYVVAKTSNGSNKSFFNGWMINKDFHCFDLGNYHPESINNDNISIGDYAIEIPNTNGLYSHTSYQKIQEEEAKSIGLYDVNYLNLAERYKGKKRHCKRVEYLVHAINNANEIVGTATAYGVPIIGIPDGYINHAFLLKGSEMIEIGKNYSAVDINDKSQVLLVETGKSFTASLVWDKGNFITLWQGGWPKAINNSGSVVGFSANGAAVIWENGKLNLLHDLLENPEGWEKLSIAEDINDRGEIVGYGIYYGCQSAFLLTPSK